MLARFKIGSAFRYARNQVSGVTGFIFSLGNIFKIPFKGIGPAAFAGSLGLSLFALKVWENSQNNTPDQPVADYKKEKIHNSTAVISRKLAGDPQKLERFKAAQTASEHPEQKTSEHMVRFDMEALEGILEKMLTVGMAQPKKWDISTSQYLHCAVTFLAQVAGHFMECLLAKAYGDPELFNFADLGIDNFIVVLLLVPALYNGYQNSKEAFVDYEKAYLDKRADEFYKKLICN